MKLKVVEFASFEEFENSGVSGQDNIITVIRENGVLKMDVMMTAKNLKSALERLHNALKNYPDIAAFVEGFLEEYKDYGKVESYSGANDIKNGCWCCSYGVEEVDDRCFYIFVNQKIWED